MSHQILVPKLIEIGGGALSKLPSVLKSLDVNYPLIVTDKMMVDLGYADKILQQLETAKFTAGLFDSVIPEPTVKSIMPGVEVAKFGNYDSIVALGGGSPIDSAKAIAILAKHGGKMSDYKVPNRVNQAGIPVIAIPTTAGTGSECTCFTVITDDISNEKMLCAGAGLMPAAAIVDYELTLTLPARNTADTGIDALTHAIESYVSKKANLFSDSQALSAMRLIAPNLRMAFNDGNDHKAREAIMVGATLAGIAFSNSSVALVHGMSRPIGAAFHVPHGLSNAMLLPKITEFSISAAPKKYANCARAMGVASELDNDDIANTKLVNELLAINKDLNVPSLQEFGVKSEVFNAMLSTMAEQALASGSPSNNPLVPNSDQIIDLYKQVWTGLS
ncbi:iron-containing alcohol dehydrogenase [Photobacterium leiognathi]|uniref:iron-containing alcohol dehydrogenase n=1 Tax=Photobacterium leiognathi TaxID=553611 RepID=UPI00298173C7|nr:iron-containing alcohol dehydrogenase [Photobacterium leiognathi]